MTTFRSDAELAHTTPVSAAADGSRLMPARELGEDLARRLLAAALPTDDRGPLLSMLDEAPELFRSIRARVEIVRTKPGCAVVRTAPGANGSNPCELVAGFLQALPRLTYGVSGSLIENTCVRRGGRACLFTLLWDASLHTRRDPVVGQAPVHSLDALASVPPVDSIAPPVPLLALEAEAPSLHATPLDAVPLHATPLDAVPLHATPLDALPLQAPPPDEPPVHLTPLAVLPDDGHELRATEPKKAKRAAAAPLEDGGHHHARPGAGANRHAEHGDGAGAGFRRTPTNPTLSQSEPGRPVGSRSGCAGGTGSVHRSG